VTATERAYGALHGILLQQASMVVVRVVFRLLGGIFADAAARDYVIHA